MKIEFTLFVVSVIRSLVLEEHHGESSHPLNRRAIKTNCH